MPRPETGQLLTPGFVDLLTLPPNWDTHGAGAIDPRIVRDAMGLINGLLGPTTPAPRVVPLSSGGIQLEWRRQGVDLEIVLDRNEQPFFYYRNRVSGDESEHLLPENSGLLRSIIGNLA